MPNVSATDQGALERFITSYYESPAPERLPEFLELAANSARLWPDAHAAEIHMYFFTKAAHGHANVIRRYEELFCKLPSARQLILPILEHVGDTTTRDLLASCLTNKDFTSESDTIRSVLQDWAPAPVNALEWPVQGGDVLDFLWADFLVTGNPQPVLRIVDVLEWPDRIRERLQVWLTSSSFLSSLFGSKERRASILRKTAGIFCDVDEQELITAEDLDCLSC